MSERIFLFGGVVIFSEIMYLLLHFLKYFRSRLVTVQVYIKHALAGSPACSSSCWGSELIPVLRASIWSIYSRRKPQCLGSHLLPSLLPVLCCQSDSFETKGGNCPKADDVNLLHSVGFDLPLSLHSQSWSLLWLSHLDENYCPWLVKHFELSVALRDPEKWTWRTYTSGWRKTF